MVTTKLKDDGAPAHAPHPDAPGVMDDRSGIRALPSAGREAIAGDDRRHSRRTRLETEVSLSSESQFFTGLSGNISEGGIFVATYRRVPLGAIVDLEFELPEGPIRAVGCVRWIREGAADSPPGIGIEFLTVSNRDQRKIERFCEARPPLYYDV